MSIGPGEGAAIRRRAAAGPAVAIDADAAPCWLCRRPLGRRVEWHHPVPKSRGGRERVAVHPICHRTLHATFANAVLARSGADRDGLAADPAIARFLDWIADKPSDFHAVTHRRKPR
ncbi:HNH endonuclease [Sphingobium sufflavum]|uniref:HNH endonuclease n=1 Tax=Sphingobium sufflavum TaxID=1129547 RepID=UPI001F24C334|nr:HNH endonuclease [Sphingobium sufflavum]MCE7795920.1 HNH endonuclease [Sphingobium sufflavum]